MKLQHKNLITFILAGGKGNRLYPLTKDRSKPAVYFAARFRIIDFVLSNCVNSGLRQVFVLTQTKSFSLEQHLRYGWNFLASQLGEFIAPVPAQQRVSDNWYSGTADAIFQNLNLLEDHRPDHVIILSGDHIYSMDFNELYQQHVETNSDLTISVLTIKKKQASEFGVLSLDHDLQIKSFIEKPEDPSMIPGDGDECHINMGIYMFKTSSLVRMLVKDAREASSHDFGKNIIPNMLGNYKVNGFLFEQSRFGHYWRDVGTIKSYFEANMDFLQQISDQTICTREWPIGTMGVPQPPSFLGGGVTIENTTIDIGSSIRNCSLKNSLIGRNVEIAEGSVVENSIIMPNSRIGRDCYIKNSIFDSNVEIPDGVTVGKEPDKDKLRFFISEGISVLPKNYRA